MNTKLRLFAAAAAAAASLGLGLCAAWAEPVAADPHALPPIVSATQALLREMQRAQDPKSSLRTRLERMEAFRPTPATADQLRAAFGTDHPYLFARQPDQAGRAAWRATLLPLRHESSPGAGIDWDAAIADLTLDKTGTMLDISGSWPRFSAWSPDLHAGATGMRFSAQRRRGYGGFWYGGARFRAAQVRIEAGQGSTVEMSDLSAEVGTTEHPKSADIVYDGRIGAIAVAGERIEDLHVGVRVVNVDKKVLAAFQAASERQQAQAVQATAPTPEQRLAAMKPLLRDFGRSAIARGTVIEIDDISARYHGSQATIRGRVGLAGAREADLDDLKALAKRIVARFEIKVPLAMVRDVAGMVAAKQAAQQAQAAPNPPANPQMGQTIADVMVGKLVGAGFAKVEDDALVSTVEWRDGQLSANGKPVPLPAGAQAVHAPHAPSSSSQVVATDASGGMPATPLADDTLQPRLVDASCRMPDYPDEVVRADKALFLLVSYRVDAEGKVRDPYIPSHTPFPDWDRAVQEALARCTYIPALRNGQPVELKMFWRIQRAPGSRSPQ